MTTIARKPAWLRRPLPKPGRQTEVAGALDDLGLFTVCQEAHCPNRGECFGQGTATFLLLGPHCTRNCTFCAVEKAAPGPPAKDEPVRVAEAVRRMKLEFCVLTMVTRDDLPDGGAGHVVRTLEAVRELCPGLGIEVLISDFGGDPEALNLVLEARPEVLNHNVETVPRLYPLVRPMAAYRRSLELLARAAQKGGDVVTKSGLMVGLGETWQELVEVMGDLRSAGCRILTIGQYLAPSSKHFPIKRFMPPEEFEALADQAFRLGFSAVSSGPYVRSSYQAARMFDQARGR